MGKSVPSQYAEARMLLQSFPSLRKTKILLPCYTRSLLILAMAFLMGILQMSKLKLGSLVMQLGGMWP